ncbi:hypothetical protein EV421DRAFT_1830775, partial [Armillaria borealis]
MSFSWFQAPPMIPAHKLFAVCLGSSGMKVSKIVLGCTVYGSSDWYSWVQNEEESIKQIKAAYILPTLFTNRRLHICTRESHQAA